MKQNVVEPLPHIETSTSYWICRSSFTERTLLNLKSKLSVLDFRTEAEVPKCVYELEGDCLDHSYVVIPKIPRQTLEYIMQRRLLFQPEYGGDGKPAKGYRLAFAPKEHQVELLRQMEQCYQEHKEKRVFLALSMGLGKTYCSANIVSKLGVKVLFVVYNAKLVQQGYEAYCRFLGPQGMYMLKNSRDLGELRYDKINVLFCTQRMLQTCRDNYGEEKLAEILHDKIGISMKIIDEVDREVGMNYWLECFTNFKYSLYLTGTKYKNLRPDDLIFQMVYKNMPTFGQDIKIPPNKIAYFVQYHFSPSKGEFYKLQMMDESLFKTYYNDYIARKDLFLDYVMKVFWNPSTSLFRKILAEEGKIVFYCGRIANCDSVKERLVKYHGVPENDIGIYNSSISKAEKAIAEQKPWILTTTDSIGRGYDDEALRCLVFLEFHFGMSTYVQNISRVGRLGGKEGYVIQGLDQSFWKVTANHQKKVNEGTYEQHFKQTYFYEVPKAWYEHYVCGYRPDREEAKNIREKEKKRQRSFSKSL